MRVLFLQSLTYPFIGVMSISTVLRNHGHVTKLEILDLNRPSQRDFDKITEYQPDVVAVPLYTGWQRGVLSFCRFLKDKMDVTVVLGGPHPTHCPDVVQDEAVDFICVGEGELAFVELIESMESGKPTDSIPGIWLTKNGRIIDNGPAPLPDLRQLPPMDIDLYCQASERIKNQENREFSLNRGCAFHCTYCNGPSLKAMYGAEILRSKTADQAIDELRYVYERYPFKSAFFTSDNLFLKRDFALEFLDKYRREIALPFCCQMRVELVDTELARLLSEAGCHMVSVGIESGSPRVRKEILGRLMSNERIVRACAILKDSGIEVNAYNMVGIPGETFEEALETVRLNSQIQPTTSWCSFLSALSRKQPYPETSGGGVDKTGDA